MGWPGTTPLFRSITIVPIEDDPAFLNLRDETEFMSLAETLARDRAREKAEYESLLLEN